MKTYLSWQISLFNGSNTAELPSLRLRNLITPENLFVPVEKYKNVVNHETMQTLLSKQGQKLGERKSMTEAIQRPRLGWVISFDRITSLCQFKLFAELQS